MQPGAPNVPQSEDCLYLNFWSPSTPGPHPVFVWIHGGGYTGGQSFAPIFDGTPFANEGIVLVTVAYRLGVFGFMDLSPLLGPDFADSANNALRDLVQSLHWVQQNISAFGGDPTRVTVGGESAGAKATAALMALPEAQPLFHSAISESGGGERVLTSTQAADVAHTFGDLWRRDHPTSTTAFNDLLTAPARDLIQTQQRVVAQSDIHFPFRPQIGPDSLLPQRPVALVALVVAGSSKGKRLLLGSNRDESALFLGPHPTADPLQRDLGNLPLDRFNEVFAHYASLYPDMPAYQRRIRAVTAEEYWVPTVRLADAHTGAGGAAWMYRLDFTPTTGRMANEAFHSEDLPFVWDKLNQTSAANPAAERLANSMHAAWCAFILGQAPAAPHLPPWPEYNPATRPTMILNLESRIEQHPSEAELRLWDGIL
jgi:para-nitrobenzyl esterase